jgi:hypothetical protein
MADNPIPKRPHYFKSQFLTLRDFDDEQTFHLEMLRRHNRGLHGWGVVRGGLQVTASPGNTGLLITPGSAIDNLGREIALGNAAVLYFQNNDQQLKWNATASAYEVSAKHVSAAAGVTGNPLDVYLTISFEESKSDDPNDLYPPPGGNVDFTRWRQTPLLKVEKAQPDDGSSIALARVKVNVGGTLGPPDMSVRPQMGCLGPLYLKSADGKTQFAVDYDSQSDALRVRARTKDAASLDATQLTIKRGTGSVGIGTTNPLGPLSVGDASVTDSDGYIVIGKKSSGGTRQYRMGFDANFNFVIGDYGANNVAATWKSPFAIRYSAPSNSLYIDDSGKVGIGTNIPKALLDVSGGGAKIGAASDVAPAAGRELVLTPVSGTSAGMVFQHNNVDTVFLKSDSTTRLTTFGANAGTFLAINNKTGNVGIGTGNADPTERLDVRSSGPDVSMNLRISNSDVTSFLSLFPGKTSNQNPAIMWPTGKPFRFGTADKVENGETSNFVERVAITGDGKVGIGVNPPGSNLHLNVPSSTNAISAMSIDVQSFSAAPNAKASHFFRVRDIGGNSTPFYIRGDGNVGIGVSDPAAKLHVGSGTIQIGTVGSFVTLIDSNITHKYASEENPRYIISRDLLGNATAGIGFSRTNNSLQTDGAAVGIPTARSLAFYTSDGSQLAERVRIDSSGKIGIGTTAPLGPLSIGDASVNGSDGYIVIGKQGPIGKTTNIGTRQYRIGFDANFNFVIGDFGANNVAATWTSPFAMFWTAPSNSLYIDGSGNVGLGTAAPTQAKLVVSGGVNAVVGNVPISYLSEQDSPGKINRELAQYAYDRRYIGPTVSIYATGDVWSGYSFISSSDERIKNIQGRSDSAADLQTLLGIEITDYIFKDVIGKGNDAYKKVIGQQVEKVFPQAVSRHTDVVPDIYRQASIQDGWVALATDLKRGERVKLLTEKGEEGVHEVLEATPDRFRTDFKPEGDRVFVFGREVEDFRTVDYDAISMLNVSATQQLKKEKDGEVQSLRAENADLKSRLDALEAAMQRLLFSGGTPVAAR